MASAPQSSSQKNKLHNFPMDLRWTRNTPIPAAEDPLPAAESEAVRANKQRGRPAAAPVAPHGGGGSERQRRVAEEKRKVKITLSKDEIEEDVYSITGARPRRPRKRPRSVQKLLDNIFPGLGLVGMSAEAYRAQEALYEK